MTGAERRVSTSGKRHRSNTNTAVLSAIFGQRIDPFSRLKPIAVLEKKRERQRTWSDGTIRYANGLDVIHGRRSPFPASDEYHHFITLAFIVQYNLDLSRTT